MRANDLCILTSTVSSSFPPSNVAAGPDRDRKREPITREQAVQIAKRVCRERRWKWDERRVFVQDQAGEWRVMTNANSLGMNDVKGTVL